MKPYKRRGIPTGGGAAREEATYMLGRLAAAPDAPGGVTPARVPVTTQANVSTRQLTGELNAAPVRAPRASNPRASRASHPPPKIQEEKGFASSDSDDGFRDSDGEGGSVAKAKNEKEEESRGSIQRYVADVQGAADDFGMPNDLEAAAQVIATRDAQQVALLDLRVCNTDRHPGNLLLQKNPVKDGPRFVPIPIDHGCTLPRWWAMGEANFPVVIINWVHYLGPPGPPTSQILGTFSRFSETFLAEREGAGP